MLIVNSCDIVKKLSYVTRLTDITFVEDIKNHITKSDILPYELYLMNNKQALLDKVLTLLTAEEINEVETKLLKHL